MAIVGIVTIGTIETIETIGKRGARKKYIQAVRGNDDHGVGSNDLRALMCKTK